MKKQFLNLGKELSKKEQKSIIGGNEWMCHGEMCSRSAPCPNNGTCKYHPTSEIMGCCGTLSEEEAF